MDNRAIPSLSSKIGRTTSTANSLVVGHGNTIPDVIKALGISEPVNISESDYDTLFMVLLGEKPYLIRLHYR